LGLTWQQSPLSEVHLDGGYDYGFSADGSAVVRTSVTLTLIRKIARGYTLELAMTPARTVNRIVPVNRTDNELRTSATVTYQFTERFDAAITSRWSWITSDDAQHALRRIETFASLTCHY
jgi:hypothetical protein